MVRAVYNKMFVETGLSSAIASAFAFFLTVSCVPALFTCFLVVHMTKILWLKILTARYPKLEFVKTDTLRSLLDTHRNQGVINVLLAVKGPCDAAAIRTQLTAVLERRDKRGELRHPRLRAALRSCWGCYAWTRALFRLDHHFLIAPGMFRGRPLSDANIQECVSEIVAKYFPPDIPPWQYIVFPNVSSSEGKYYILVRVHHLLLSGRGSLNIGDLLMIKSQDDQPAYSAPPRSKPMPSPLEDLIRMPTAIPELYSKLSESCSNRWNEFISEYDPVESPQALKSDPGMVHCVGLVIIILVSALREFAKGKSNEQTDSSGQLNQFIKSIKHECRRREFTVSKVLLSVFVTLDPRTIFMTSLRSFKYVVSFLLLWPITVLNEVNSLRTYIAYGHSLYPNTFVFSCVNYIPLIYGAAKEFVYIMGLIYTAPIVLYTDILCAEGDMKRHNLQTISLCGRKVTSWSAPVSAALVNAVARQLGVSDTDVMLYATVGGLQQHFVESNLPVPEQILTTARAATQEFLLSSSEGNGKYYKKTQTGAMVCLSLSTSTASGADSVRTVQASIRRALLRQASLAALSAAQTRWGLLTRALPSPAARLLLNMLSRRFAVSYAEVRAPAEAGTRRTAWGDELLDIVYWRPPQANVSISFTVMQYAGTVRLAVMSDARLSPSHHIPTLHWPQYIEALAKELQTPVPDPALLQPPQGSTVSPPLVRRRIARDE